MSSEAGSRESQAQERREQLLDVALKLFGEVGVKRTTIKMLSETAGVSQGLIYHYFEGKEDLLRQVVQRYSMLAEMERTLGTLAGRPAREVLPELGQRFYELLLVHREVVWIIFRELHGEPAVAAEIEHNRQRCTRLLSQYLESRVVAGELRPHRTEVTARSFLAVLFMMHLVGLPSDDFIAEFADCLLTGILPR